MTNSISFQHIDWSALEVEIKAGASGHSETRTLEFPGLRLRMIYYSPGYLADHWCQKGHIVHCLEGSFESEMESGGSVILSAGQSYVVSDKMSSHRSISPDGARLLIIDGDFLR